MFGFKIISMTAVLMASGFAVAGMGAPSFAQDAAPAEQVENTAEAPAHYHGDVVYGSPDAPVEVIEYASFTCSHCKSFHDKVLTPLKTTLIAEGKVRVVFRNFVRDRVDLLMGALARCTDSETETKNMIDLFFAGQEEVLHSQQPGIAIQAIAQSGGLTLERMNECGSSRPLAEHLIEMRQLGIQTYDVKATPTVIINGTKVDFDGFEDLLNKIELASFGK